MKAKMMEEETDYYLSQDGLRLYFRHWFEGDPKGVVCIVHGLGEHGGRYRHVAAHLTRSGYAVLAVDLRGHGRSQGKRGHSASYELLLGDVEELLKTARAIYTDLPLYLMGHSMGGNIVANFMIRMNTNELEGFILSSPWLKLSFDPPKWKLRLGKLIADILPSLTQPNGLIVNHISKDEKEVAAYVADPLVHDRISAGLFQQIQAAGVYALQNAGKISDQGLVYHGDADQIIDWQATKQFAQACESGSWKQLEGVYHEPHNDLEKNDVLSMITGWLDTHKKRDRE